MLGIRNMYSYCLNSEDLMNLDLLFKKSYAKGGSMALWKKWLDPYVIVPPQPSSSSFLPIILSLPYCHDSIHISVYLPTSGKDQEYTAALTDLQACTEKLLDAYPEAHLYFTRRLQYK